MRIHTKLEPPEYYANAALQAQKTGAVSTAQLNATLGVLSALLQFEVCDHGTRGFCKDCQRKELLELINDWDRKRG